MRDDGSNARNLEALAGLAENFLNERRQILAVLGKDRHGVRRKPCTLQRVDAFCRPRDVLEHSDGKEAGLEINHGRVM